MRVRLFLLFALGALTGCGGEAAPATAEYVRPRDSAPKVGRYKAQGIPAAVRHGVIESEFAFLQKPFTPPVLAQTVRAALDGGR